MLLEIEYDLPPANSDLRRLSTTMRVSSGDLTLHLHFIVRINHGKHKIKLRLDRIITNVPMEMVIADPGDRIVFSGLAAYSREIAAHFGTLFVVEDPPAEDVARVIRQALENLPVREGRTSTRLVAGILSRAALLLPVSARQRWREEWRAELVTLPTVRLRVQFLRETLVAAIVLSGTLRRPTSRVLAALENLIDSTLMSEWRTWMAAAIPTAAAATYFLVEEDDGFHGVAANIQSIAVVAIFAYSALRLWRKTRGLAVRSDSKDEK